MKNERGFSNSPALTVLVVLALLVIIIAGILFIVGNK